MNQPKMFLLQLIHDIMEVLAKLKTKSLILYQSTILMWITFFLLFAGQLCEPKEQSMRLFGTFHLSEITLMQEKVISPNFGVFTLR